METTPEAILRDKFGYDSFRPPQEEIVARLMAGGDALVLMPTGGGKSLCFQIPAIARPGTGIVVSPLIALMHDQVEGLRQNGVRAASLNSTLSAAAARAVEEELLNGTLDLLYIAPERLLLDRTLDLFARARIALFAIDEAHCVSQWGHDFRPEYIRLSVLHERFPEVPRIALTATADEPTRREIIDRLALDKAELFISSFDRPNIRYRIAESHGSAREALLRLIRDEHAGDAGIVYCLSRRRVDEIASWLSGRGVDALPYHAGMTAVERTHNQSRFIREEGVVIVATIAFGMGIDKPNVRFVAHLNLPKSIEAYYQETGRAGRDGLPANAWMSYGLQDVITLRQMMDGSGAEERHKRIERHKLDAMLGLCEITTCRRQALLAHFGERLDTPCGNCDNCLEPAESWDATEPARMALSCVHRTGQRFGVNYLIDVLRGQENERIRRFGHDRQSTYGIGAAIPAGEWRGIFRQLLARGLLAVDHEGHGALHLTEGCRPVLRGEEELWLRRARRPVRRSRAERPTGGRITFEDIADERLWEALRTRRRELAEEQGVPPYVVFHDATLAGMVHHHPETIDQLARLPGVGAHKLKAYGDSFLQIIRQYTHTPSP